MCHVMLCYAMSGYRLQVIHFADAFIQSDLHVMACQATYVQVYEIPVLVLAVRCQQFSWHQRGVVCLAQTEDYGPSRGHRL